MQLDLSADLVTEEDRRTKYLEYEALQGSAVVSRGTTLFVRLKTFDFAPCHVNTQVEEQSDAYVITLSADGFAKSVRVSLSDNDCLFSDNWFDLHGTQKRTISVPKDSLTAPVSRASLMTQLQVTHY